MSDLLRNIKILLDDAIVSERKTASIYVMLNEAREGLVNEKFVDVAGLKMPNFLISLPDIKERLDGLESMKFAVEMRIEDKNRKDSEKKEIRWKESTAKIRQKDEYTLEGIETWYISHYEMFPNYGDIHSPLLREEARKLVASGFDLAFNCSYGTGSVIATDGGFIIELWQYMNKTAMCKNTLDEVIDWIIYFYENG
jgi:hypothetical protein